MNKDTLIISMTSFPPRINAAAKAWNSVLMQNVDRNLYHCVLVLCDKEFPNKEQDLPNELRLLIDNGLIEVIWYPNNIRSHKKLIPTLKKYPNNPILVIDDDMLRPAGWLECFMADHAAHPNDIIAGMIAQYIENNRFRMYYHSPLGNTNFGQIVPNGRPANGRGGTLYPPNTFTDERFFDEDLFMKLTPTSDESWQFYFNHFEHKNVRLISKPLNVSMFIKGTQEQATALSWYNHSNDNYNKIWQRLLDNVEMNEN